MWQKRLGANTLQTPKRLLSQLGSSVNNAIGAVSASFNNAIGIGGCLAGLSVNTTTNSGSYSSTQSCTRMNNNSPAGSGGMNDGNGNDPGIGGNRGSGD